MPASWPASCVEAHRDTVGPSSTGLDRRLHMTRFAMAVGLGATLLLLAGQADAQWRYTDDKGTSKVTQYRIDVPAPHRDAAEWIGPVGVGNPALSEDQLRAARHWEAVQRLIAAETALMQIKPVP